MTTHSQARLAAQSSPLDTTPPSVSITSPAAGERLTRTVTISATAADAAGIMSVTFRVDGTIIDTDDRPPYSARWNTRNAAEGSHTLRAEARDAAGNVGTSAPVSVIVGRATETAPPNVKVTSPADGAQVTGTVAVTADASDAVGVTSVTFLVDAAAIGTDTSAPYSVSWNTSAAAAGSHTLRAQARNAAGNVGTSSPVTVTTVATANQPPTVTLTAPANGATFTAPATMTVSATVSDTDGTVTTVEFYRDGTTLIGSDTTSPYSMTWSNVAAGSYSLTAVARDNAGATTTSAGRSITVTGLPAGWTAADIGAPAIAGSTQYANGTFTVTGAGVDVWDRSDQFQYVYQAFTGDIEITSRVVSLENTHEWAKAGVMIRQTLAANAVQTSLVVTPGQGTNFYRRLAAGDLTQPGLVGPAAAPHWVRLVRRGSTVTGFQSSDGVTWTAVGTATMATATMYVGLEVTSHDPAQAATAVFDNVTVRVPSGNQAPTVSLTAPATGSSYTAPAAITVAASATDADGTVARVDFYEGSAKIGSDTTSPFSIAWTLSTADTYVFSATAVDNAGATATSGSATVTVTSPGPSRPTKAIFNPSADHSSVIHYVLDVFPEGSNPATSSPVAMQDLGKPSVVNGEITADIASTMASLPPATYIATVSAITSSQSARSPASPPFVISASSPAMATAWQAPRAMAWDAPRAAASAADPHGVLWVTNSSTALVTAFDATTGDVLATIPVGLRPTGIAAPKGVGKVYVADESSDTVSVISKATMTVVRTILLPAPFDRKPHHISGSPDGRFVYVAELGANVVDVIDTATDQISSRFSTGWPGSKTRVVVPDSSGAVLYALNLGAAPSPSTLVALDADTGHWLWQLPIEGDPSDLLITADGRTAVVARHTDSAIEVIDLERHAVLETIDLGPGNQAGRLTLNGRLVLVTLSTTPPRMGIVDLAAMTALSPVSLAGSTAGSALSARQLFYVCDPGSSEFPPGVVAVDAGSRTIVRRFRLPGGGSPYAVVFDPE